MRGPARWVKLTEPGSRIFSKIDILTAHLVFARAYGYRRRALRAGLCMMHYSFLDEYNHRGELGMNGQDIYDDLVAKWADHECKGRGWQ